MDFHHLPILLNEVIDGLRLKGGGIYVDGTLGGAGHSKALLEAANIRLIGIDQDRDALQAAGERLQPFGERVSLNHANFAELEEVLDRLAIPFVDGILLDIGVSSYQLDTAERGFSYQHDAPLDMRMNRQGETTAADLVNGLNEEELAEILWEYGEERWSKRIAKFIVEARPLETTGQLVDVIKKAIPAGARQDGPHPAKRTFQALRIAVNNELGVLEKALAAAIKRLNRGGRLAVITFHSLEDRMVKQAFQESAKGCICPPGLPICACGQVPMIKIITKKPILPSPGELAENPRARSAKLRIAEKL